MWRCTMLDARSGAGRVSELQRSRAVNLRFSAWAAARSRACSEARGRRRGGHRRRGRDCRCTAPRRRPVTSIPCSVDACASRACDAGGGHALDREPVDGFAAPCDPGARVRAPSGVCTAFASVDTGRSSARAGGDGSAGWCPTGLTGRSTLERTIDAEACVSVDRRDHHDEHSAVGSTGRDGSRAIGGRLDDRRGSVCGR